MLSNRNLIATRSGKLREPSIFRDCAPGRFYVFYRTGGYYQERRHDARYR